MRTSKLAVATLAAILIANSAQAGGRGPADPTAEPEPVAAAESAPAPAAEAAPPEPSADERSAVVAEAERWLGSRNMTGKRGPWCAHFASYVLEKTGHRPLANGLVASALAYGRRLSEPKVGALVVVNTRVGHAAHVGFVANVNEDGSIELISGNWARRVSDSTVSRRSVVAIVDVE